MSCKSHLLILILLAVSILCENANNQLVSDYENRQWKKLKKQGGRILIPIAIAVFVIKLILLPFVLKALAVVSGISVVMSVASLVLSALVGIKRGDDNGLDFKPHFTHEKNDYLFWNDGVLSERYVTQAAVEYPHGIS